MEHIAYTFFDSYIQKFLSKEENLLILDVGSQDISGSYRKNFDFPNWKYHGLDIVAGNNVDIVVKDPYYWIFNGRDLQSHFDVSVSGQCLEHVEMPWLTAKEMYRVCKANGYCFISVPQVFPKHNYPIDCWRFHEDGVIALMQKWAGFKTLVCETVGYRRGKIFTFWVGRK